MNRIITVVKTMTTILALYNEAQRAGLIDYINNKRKKTMERLVSKDVMR